MVQCATTGPGELPWPFKLPSYLCFCEFGKLVHFNCCCVFVNVEWNLSESLSIWLYAYATPMTITEVHYSDVIMSAMASQITSLTIVYSTIYSGADQRKHQSSTSLHGLCVHRGLVNSPHRGPVTRKMLPFDDVIVNLVHLINGDVATLSKSGLTCTYLSVSVIFSSMNGQH